MLQNNEYGFSRSNRGFQFNLSHSNGLAVYALTNNCLIGVDVEYTRVDFDLKKLSKHFFSSRENKLINSSPKKYRTQTFFDCWTRKEAFIKLLGNGFVLPLDQLDFPLHPEEHQIICQINIESRSISQCDIHTFQPAKEYSGAVAIERNQVKTYLHRSIDRILPKA